MKTRAFSPAGISSFFQACLWDPKGELIKDPALIGSRGGGIVIKKGVTTEIEATPSDKAIIKVFINDKLTPNAHTTKTAIKLVLKETEVAYEVLVRHQIAIPISAGYGTSGAGALSSAIAMNELLGLRLSKFDIGRIAHIAEVECRTGLGSVSGIMNGGLVLVTVPGVDGLFETEQIPLDPEWKVVSALISPIRTQGVISSYEKLRKINEYGKITLRSIKENPTVKHFFKACKDFAIKTGLMSELIKKLTDVAEKNGAIGATQNMIGNAIHSVVEPQFVANVVSALKNHLVAHNIFISDIDLNGPMLL